MLRKYVSLFLLTAALAFGTTLTGTLNLPDGTGATGALWMSLSQPGALSPAGSCGGPIEIVPTVEIRITVTAGVLQSPPALYGNDCILPQGTYYNVRFTDSRGNVLLVDRWQLSGASVDIGTIVSVVVTGTTGYLGSTGVLVTDPIGDQTVTQPSGTNLRVNKIVVTDTFQAPGNVECSATTGQCRFVVTAAFLGGFGNSPGTSAVVYVGDGNMYLRHYSGQESCVGVDDAWVAIRTDTKKIIVCIGGQSYSADLTLNP